MGHLRAIESYLIKRKADGEDSDYRKRKEHFDSLLSALRNNEENKFQQLLETGIKSFSSFGHSNRYAKLLAELKSEIHQSEVKLNTLKQEAQKEISFVNDAEDGKEQETTELTKIKHTLYVIAPRLLASTDISEKSLLKVVNFSFASIFLDKEAATKGANFLAGRGHAIIQLKVSKEFYKEAAEQYKNITEFQLKKEVTKENLHLIIDMYDGKELTINEAILSTQSQDNKESFSSRYNKN